MPNLIALKTSKEFELLEQMNAVQHSVIVNLQNENEQLQDKIKHLEQLLFSRAYIIESK